MFDIVRFPEAAGPPFTGRLVAANPSVYGGGDCIDVFITKFLRGGTNWRLLCLNRDVNEVRQDNEHF